VLGADVVVEQQAAEHLVEERVRPPDAAPFADRFDPHLIDRVVEPRLGAAGQRDHASGEHRGVDPVFDAVDPHDDRGVRMDRAAHVVAHRARAAPGVEPEGAQERVQPARARPGRAPVGRPVPGVRAPPRSWPPKARGHATTVGRPARSAWKPDRAVK
jgi:hypothetical protein